MTIPKNCNKNYADLAVAANLTVQIGKHIENMRKTLNKKLLIIEQKRALGMSLTEEENAIYVLYGAATGSEQ